MILNSNIGFSIYLFGFEYLISFFLKLFKKIELFLDQ